MALLITTQDRNHSAYGLPINPAMQMTYYTADDASSESLYFDDPSFDRR